MRIFRNFYKKIIFILSLKFFVAADADFQAGIHGPFNPTGTTKDRSGKLIELWSVYSWSKVHKRQSDGVETTTAPSRTTASFIPWEATTTSVAMTTMTPKRPSDGKNLCSVDAHCGPGGKCGPYCPIIEGLGTGSITQILVRVDFYVSAEPCRVESMLKVCGVHTKTFAIALQDHMECHAKTISHFAMKIFASMVVNVTILIFYKWVAVIALGLVSMGHFVIRKIVVQGDFELYKSSSPNICPVTPFPICGGPENWNYCTFKINDRYWLWERYL